MEYKMIYKISYINKSKYIKRLIKVNYLLMKNKSKKE